MEDNPFSKLYKQIWNLFESNDRISSVVLIRNREKYESPLGPKQSELDADKPSLELRPDGFVTRLRATSSSTDIIKDYSVFISTGDWNLNKYFNYLSWELIKSVNDWDTNLTSLRWNNRRFVKSVEFLDAIEGTDERDINAGTQGWAALWRIQIKMMFVTSEVRV